jgi:hypothetical protein
MQISSQQGPSLAEVIAFTILESADNVARVERAARHRLRRKHAWSGFEVFAVEVEPAADELSNIKAYCAPVAAPHSQTLVLEFLTDTGDKRRSPRFDAFLSACGVKERVDDTREIEGRYFSVRNGGRIAADFGPLALSVL